MITVDTDFKQAMTASAKRVRGYLQATDGTKYQPGDNLTSYTITATGGLLQTSMKQIDIVLLGKQDGLIGSTLTAYYGVKTTDFEYLPQGVFNILKAEYSEDGDTTKLTGYDNMVLFQKQYGSVSDFPTTLGDFLNALCAGVGVHNATDTLYNGGLSMPEDYWLNVPDITYRDVLRQICEVSVTTARITPDGSLILVPVDNPTGETLQYENLLTYKANDKYGGVNSVVLSRQPQNDDIFQQDEADINYPTTKNILDLNAFNVTYSADAA